MIKLTALYPNGGDARFDMAYYCDKHIPMVRKLLGDACKKVEVDEGLSTEDPNAKPQYVAIGHLYFDSPDGLQKFMANIEAIAGDVPNYTNVQPVVQISRVRL